MSDTTNYNLGFRCSNCTFFRYYVMECNGWEKTEFICTLHKESASITNPTEQVCDDFYSKKANERQEKIKLILNED